MTAFIHKLSQNWLHKILDIFSLFKSLNLFALYNKTEDLPKERQQEIIEEFKSNPEIFEEIYSHYYDQIFKYIIKRTSSADIAYDICAETFIKAFENFHKFKWQNFSIKVWLFRIATNNITNSYRKRKHQTLAIENVPEGLEGMAFHAADELKELDSILFEDEQLANLSKSIKKLNPKYQEVISLYYFSNLSQKEIATTINRSVSAVKSMMNRAMTKLKAELN